MSYVVAGIYIVMSSSRGRLRGVFTALGVVTTLEGLGSLQYHGAESNPASFLHDVALVGTLAFIAGWHVGRLIGRPDSGALIGMFSGLALAALLSPAGRTNAVAVAAVVVAASAELAARRREMPAVWNGWLLVLVVAAVLAWLAGTPQSPFCDEESWLQPHALWHALTAFVIAGWAVRANKGFECSTVGSATA